MILLISASCQFTKDATVPAVPKNECTHVFSYSFRFHLGEVSELELTLHHHKRALTVGSLDVTSGKGRTGKPYSSTVLARVRAALILNLT